MKKNTQPCRFLSVFCFSILLLCTVFSTGPSAHGALLPEGLTMAESFEPGLGHPIGRVVLVQGEVVLIHEKKLRGYYAEKDLPLFKGDMIITLKKGRIRFKLNDDSVLTLASKTKLTLSKSVYDGKKKTRSSFLKMAFGKARFFVKKLVAFRRSEFKVKTPTAVMGVRGSDFITRVWKTDEMTVKAPGIQVADASDKAFLHLAQRAPGVSPGPQGYITEVTALQNTRLEVVSLAAPEIPPTVLKDFEQSTIKVGERPTPPLIQTPQAIDRLMKDLVVKPEPIRPGSAPEMGRKPGDKGKTRGGDAKAPGAESGVSTAGAPPVEQPAPAVETKGVLVSEDQLVNPRDISGPQGISEPVTPEIPLRERAFQAEATAAEQQEKIIEETFEKSVITAPKALPAFPQPPGERVQHSMP